MKKKKKLYSFFFFVLIIIFNKIFFNFNKFLIWFIKHKFNCSNWSISIFSNSWSCNSVTFLNASGYSMTNCSMNTWRWMSSWKTDFVFGMIWASQGRRAEQWDSIQIAMQFSMSWFLVLMNWSRSTGRFLKLCDEKKKFWLRAVSTNSMKTTNQKTRCWFVSARWKIAVGALRAISPR